MTPFWIGFFDGLALKPLWGTLPRLLKAQLRSWQRWKRADRLGWSTAGRLLGIPECDQGGFRAQWCARNANRLYRLTRGGGNPWRDECGCRNVVDGCHDGVGCRVRRKLRGEA